MRTPLRALIAAALLCATAALAALDERAALRDSQAAIGRQLGDFGLRDTESRTVRLAEFRGRPLVVHFVYTGCYQVCPTTTKALGLAVQEAERALGKGAFNVLTIGFNLPFDTPQAMKDFARRYGIAAPNWRFLSPEAETLPALVENFGFRYEQTTAGFDHLLQASIVDGQGRIYRQLYGDSFGGPQFTGPLLELAQNAPRPQGDIAAWIAQVKLLCTVYDPSSGRYRLNYAVLIEILIGSSVMLLGIVSVAIEWRRRRRARAAGG